MKMRNLAAVAVTGMMVLGMAGNVCAADTITAVDGTDTQNVQATYEATTAASTVYSVDIIWGNMLYKYTVADEGTWNPQTHQFDNASTAGEWNNETNANKVTVTNHSNAAVKAELSYTPAENYKEITGLFDKSILNLKTAEGTQVAEAPKADASLTLSGALDKSVKTATTVGMATVTLRAAN